MSRKRSGEIYSAKLIDWHAQHISNPLDRLRYLRTATVQVPASDFTRRWRVVWPLLLAALAVSSVASLRAWRGSTPDPEASRPKPARATAPAKPAVAAPLADVWLVDHNGDDEEYSNGLRIDNHWTVPNRPRSYPVFDPKHLDRGPAAWMSEPAGIVFHTTESDQIPFEPAQNGALKSIAENLLGYVQQKRAYNFVVDRFGRVHRIVKETDAANHSGYSVWADDRWLYLNLNDSFFGVSFEAQTRRGGEPASITPAQIRAGALLIEMLRSRYKLAVANCVTHAQVSVNPSNMQIGYHTDWAANFPFTEVGLPDNYGSPLPGLFLCGFDYDRDYLTSTGGRVEAAVALSESKLADAAVARRMPVAAYRDFLKRQYRKNLLALRKGAPEGDAS
ncbi:MAG: peptidoglycan recognition family protein [Acidobacteriota bacterium]